MSNVALTAKYRPQTFADVAGQETLKAILSRAALEDKVAPAYLFSGTRGVGKTTLARVFAKAINCRTAPTAEPCNTCDLCRSITLGISVDVVEMDGASNRGIEDMRKLKEVVGYAPMDGRYKIFIIDEAHMLTKEAFNALLKTLEEPPARVTFIMATTEPHKFPATIISRCQHYVFKPVSEAVIVAHLEGVLNKEQISFEPSAVRLIARRGAGSVRDSMSLLGQVLAFGTISVTEEIARSVLGLVGQEAFLSLLASIREARSSDLVVLLHAMLDQGIDIGFFLKELGSLWRDLFILRQSGEAGLVAVDMPENEARRLLDEAQNFSLTHLHACWQMTLEGQRRISTSLEPALGLELLLLNLAMLPELLSLETLSNLGRRANSTGSNPAGGGRPVRSVSSESSKTASVKAGFGSSKAPVEVRSEVSRVKSPTDMPVSDISVPECSETRPVKDMEATSPTALQETILSSAVSSEESMPVSVEEPLEVDTDKADVVPVVNPSWQDILDVCTRDNALPWLAALGDKVTAKWSEGNLELFPNDRFLAERLLEPQSKQVFVNALSKLCAMPLDIASACLQIHMPANIRKDRDSLKQEVYDHPLVQEMEKTLGARIIDFGQSR